MKVLVTGAAGYFGGHVVSALLDRGHHVIGLDACLRKEGPLAVAPWMHHPKFAFHRLNLMESPVDDVFGLLPDATVHLAAVVGADACQANPALAHHTNVSCTRRVMDRAKDIDSRLIFASTCSNYGAQVEVCDEGAPLVPLSLYAKTKIEGEDLVRGYGNHVVFRFATLCGAGIVAHRPELMVNDWALKVARSETVEIYSPEAYRPHLHIADAARAIAWAVEGNETGTFNVVDENLTKRELMTRICDVVGRRVRTREAGQSDVRDYRVNGDKLRAHGWVPEHGIDAAIRAMAQMRDVL